MWYGEKRGFRELDDFITQLDKGDATFIGEIESVFGQDIVQYTAFDLNQSVGQPGFRIHTRPTLRVKAVDVLITEKQVDSMESLLAADTLSVDPFEPSDIPISDPFEPSDIPSPDPFELVEITSFEEDRGESLAIAAEESLSETVATAVENLLVEKMDKAQTELVK